MERTLFLLFIVFIIMTGCGEDDKSSSNSHEDDNLENDILLGISDSKTIEGHVVEKRTKGVTLEVFDESKDLTYTIRVGVKDKKMLSNVKKGQNIIIWYDYIRESNPPQTTALKIEHIKADK